MDSTLQKPNRGLVIRILSIMYAGKWGHLQERRGLTPLSRCCVLGLHKTLLYLSGYCTDQKSYDGAFDFAKVA
jgi:hypothetical protein